MTQQQAAATAKEKLLARRTALTLQRQDLEAAVVELSAEKRPDELAENDELAGVQVLLSGKDQAELGELDAALERLRLGTWGLCERCHRPIAAARLTVVPEAGSCVDCAERTP
jgi:RNA polymerase-binding transcription factor DksA